MVLGLGLGRCPAGAEKMEGPPWDPSITSLGESEANMNPRALPPFFSFVTPVHLWLTIVVEKELSIQINDVLCTWSRVSSLESRVTSLASRIPVHKVVA